MNSFPAEDGHIESILIGCSDVKISFQTWNEKALVIIFRDCEKIVSANSVYGDIGMFQCEYAENNINSYSFYDALTNEILLNILAKRIEIYEVGTTGNINGALFDVGYEYIGSIVKTT